MSKKVTVIHCSEDGDRSVVVCTREELLKRLNENYYGHQIDIFDPAQMPPSRTRGLEGVARSPARASGERVLDLDSFVGIVVIDGEPVAPVPEEKVTRWKLP